MRCTTRKAYDPALMAAITNVCAHCCQWPDAVLHRFLSNINERTNTPLLATIITGLMSSFMSLLVGLQILVEMMSIGQSYPTAIRQFQKYAASMNIIGNIKRAFCGSVEGHCIIGSARHTLQADVCV